MDKNQYMLSMLPEHWDTTSNKSKIKAIVNAIADEFDIFDDQLSVVDGLIGIDTTYGIDLDKRWGKLFDLPRRRGESDDLYRGRIKLSIIRLMGGTSDAIKYGVASLFRTDGDIQSDYDKYVQVYDAWEYDGIINVPKTPGNSVCVVNVCALPYYDDNTASDIQKLLSTVKAAGINVAVLAYGAYDEVYTFADDVEQDGGTLLIILPYDDNDMFIVGNSVTNMSQIADGFETATICSVGETGTDIIKESGKANVVINY